MDKHAGRMLSSGPAVVKCGLETCRIRRSVEVLLLDDLRVLSAEGRCGPA
jgi:hypothetical protein